MADAPKSRGPTSGQIAAVAVVIAILAGYAAIERGWLSGWLGPVGAGDKSASSAVVAWSGVDCPPGLARCAGGVVEGSVAAQLPSPCSGPPEKCTCPWVRIGVCPNGCAADLLQRVAEADAAVAQLCAPEPDAAVFHRVVTASDPLPAGAACDGERFRCRAAMVLACPVGSPRGAPARPVAVCTKGCDNEDDDLEEDVSESAAVALLCHR